MEYMMVAFLQVVEIFEQELLFMICFKYGQERVFFWWTGLLRQSVSLF